MINVKIFDRLMWLALGGRSSWEHLKGKENKNTTALQNLLDDHMRRQPKVGRNVSAEFATRTK